MKRFLLALALTLCLSSNSQASLPSLFLDDLGELQEQLVQKDLTSYGTDFHKNVTSEPLAVFKPRTSTYLAQFLKIASQHNVAVSARGMGRSALGQSHVNGGVIVDLSNLIERPAFRIAKILKDGHEVDEKSITVPAYMTWYDIINSARKKKLTVPVTLDFLKLSIGGSLSCAGGIGGASYLKGSAADHVKMIEVVTMDGQLLECDRSNDIQMFNAALCGLGQFGIITRVELSLVDAPSMVTKYSITYDDPAKFFRDQKVLYEEKRFDYLKGFLTKTDDKWHYVIEAARYIGLTDQFYKKPPFNFPDAISIETEHMKYWRFVNEVTHFVDALQAAGKLAHPMPWYNVLMPESAVPDHLALILETEHLTGTEPIIVYPMNSEHFNVPNFRRPEGTFYLIGVLYNTGFGNSADFPHKAILERNAALYKIARAKGGYRFPVDATRFTPEDWQEHFGEEWIRFQAMKGVYDPKNLLGTGVGIFPK